MPSAFIPQRPVIASYPKMQEAFAEAEAMSAYLKEKGIIVRNRSNVILCESSLRITVGTPDQDTQLLEALKAYK